MSLTRPRTLTRVAASLGHDEDDARDLLCACIERGWVTYDPAGDTFAYKSHVIPRSVGEDAKDLVVGTITEVEESIGLLQQNGVAKTRAEACEKIARDVVEGLSVLVHGHIMLSPERAIDLALAAYLLND